VLSAVPSAQSPTRSSTPFPEPGSPHPQVKHCIEFSSPTRCVAAATDRSADGLKISIDSVADLCAGHRSVGVPRLSRRTMRLCQLSASVEQVVADLMEGVKGYPAQRPLSPLRIVVHDAAAPVIGTQTAKDASK
jgi:hypothetical protein